MKRRKLIKQLGLSVPALMLARGAGASGFFDTIAGNGIADCPFKPYHGIRCKTYQTPEWFRNAKFGLWAHWGPQCQPEYGDWYARGMYQESSAQYQNIILTNTDIHRYSGSRMCSMNGRRRNGAPEELVALYKKRGCAIFLWRWPVTTIILICSTAVTSPNGTPRRTARAKTLSVVGQKRLKDRACLLA